MEKKIKLKPNFYEENNIVAQFHDLVHLFINESK